LIHNPLLEAGVFVNCLSHIDTIFHTGTTALAACPILAALAILAVSGLLHLILL